MYNKSSLRNIHNQLYQLQVDLHIPHSIVWTHRHKLLYLTNKYLDVKYSDCQEILPKKYCDKNMIQSQISLTFRLLLDDTQNSVYICTVFLFHCTYGYWIYPYAFIFRSFLLIHVLPVIFLRWLIPYNLLRGNRDFHFPNIILY